MMDKKIASSGIVKNSKHQTRNLSEPVWTFDVVFYSKSAEQIRSAVKHLLNSEVLILVATPASTSLTVNDYLCWMQFACPPSSLVKACPFGSVFASLVVFRHSAGPPPE